jgi:signal transduction histidine kinase/ligand-binding sensor domain-containing protein
MPTKYVSNRRGFNVKLVDCFTRTAVGLRLRLATAMFALGFLTAAISAQSDVAAPLADQYVRTNFTVEDGLPDNVVNAVVQTSNGLLWVGTDLGLATFDGREFRAVDLSRGGTRPQGAVHALLQSSNGDLWAGTDLGVVRIPKMALDRFNPASVVFYRQGTESSGAVNVLFQARGGDIWAGTSRGQYRLERGEFVRAFAVDGVSRIAEARNGNLLLIAGDQFLEWDGHQIVQHPGLAASLGVRDREIYEAFQDEAGTMWYGTAYGLFRRAKAPLPPLQPSSVANTQVFRISQDRVGQIWITSRLGFYRLKGDQLETPAPGLIARSSYVSTDGDLWIGTNGYGLVHLRRRNVRMFAKADGLPEDNVMALLPAHDEKLWVGSNCGFYQYDGTKFKSYSEKDGLLNTCVWALAEDHNHDVWIGTYGGGAFQMHDGHFIQYTVKQGLASDIVLQILVAQDGSLWIVTLDGLSHMQNGHIRNYTTRDGLSGNQVLSVHQDRAGVLWAATQAGIDRLVGDRFAPFPVNRSQGGIFWTRFAEDSSGNLFTLGSPNGIGLITQDRIIHLNNDLKVLDMIQSPDHDLWFSAKNGIIRIRSEDLKSAASNREDRLNYQVFDRSDGLASVQCSVGLPNVVLTDDGRLWAATVSGLAMIELAKTPRETLPPKVFVGGITLGKDTAHAGEELVLPPGTHHLELHLEAIDLASPEKVRIQYRMDGVDPFWIDANTSRTAVYSSMPAGTHNFHVRASASNGVWDRTGIIYKVTQRPYFYQTIWFLLLTVGAFILLISGLYVMRVRQVLRMAQVRMGERLEERERIARELHDTLLQGVMSAALQLDFAEEQMPGDSPAKSLVNRVLQILREVVEEGRVALRSLRTHGGASSDLATALLHIQQQVPADERIEFRVTAQNTALPLHPQIWDEVYRIGREAVLNAFAHGNAKSIEVKIEYAGTYLRVLVRDDGCGIEPHVLQTGREGHWGLSGMRERAEKIGAVLKLRSQLGVGTELELTVPAAIAFEGGSQRRLWKWLSWLRREAFFRAQDN